MGERGQFLKRGTSVQRPAFFLPVLKKQAPLPHPPLPKTGRPGRLGGPAGRETCSSVPARAGLGVVCPRFYFARPTGGAPPPAAGFPGRLGYYLACPEFSRLG